MEILTSLLKKYINLSLFEILVFFLFGLFFIWVVKSTTLLSLFTKFFQLEVDLNKFPLNLFFIIFWLLAFLLGKKLMGGVFKYALSLKSYTFKSEDWPRKWAHQGNIRIWEMEADALLITDSNSGCILNGHYWKNFELSFDCKFPSGEDDNTLGIVFRAQSLSDYLMVQINNKEKYIMPHVRMEGKWETNRQPLYSTTFAENTYYRVKLKVLDEKVELHINGNKFLDWNIPTNSDLIITTPNAENGHSNTFVPEINFRNSYGKIGFRDYQGECAIVKNLRVHRLRKFL